MPIMQKKWDWTAIKQGFLDSDYKELNPYLREIWKMDDSTIYGGQLRRKLGNARDLEKIKEMKGVKKVSKKLLENPKKYLQKLIVNDENALKNTAIMAKQSLYRTLFGAVMGIEERLNNEEIEEMEVIKYASGFKTLLDIIEGVEQGLTREDGRLKKVKASIEGAVSEGDESERGSGEDGERGGSDNHKQMVFVTVQPDKPKN
jgi:soluble cytochrome b562